MANFVFFLTDQKRLRVYVPLLRKCHHCWSYSYFVVTEKYRKRTCFDSAAETVLHWKHMTSRRFENAVKQSFSSESTSIAIRWRRSTACCRFHLEIDISEMLSLSVTQIKHVRRRPERLESYSWHNNVQGSKIVMYFVERSFSNPLHKRACSILLRNRDWHAE